MRPAVGVSKPAMARNVVVLPQPLGPSSVTTSPRRAVKLSARTARIGPCGPSVASTATAPLMKADRLRVRSTRPTTTKLTASCTKPRAATSLAFPFSQRSNTATDNTMLAGVEQDGGAHLLHRHDEQQRPGRDHRRLDQRQCDQAHRGSHVAPATRAASSSSGWSWRSAALVARTPNGR